MDIAENLLTGNEPKAELKDTSANIQFVEAGIVIAGGLTAYVLYSIAHGNALLYGAAAAAAVITIVAAIVVHKNYGNKIGLQHFEDRIVLADRDKLVEIPFDELQAYSASWSDLYVNGVYSTTTVKLSFDKEGGFRVHQYDSSASYSTLKYEQLEALQADASNAIASRMRKTLLDEGFVPWTAQLTISKSGIEYRKRGIGDAQLIPFPGLGKWEVDSGIFKLALQGERRPSITEPTSQTNFFPGLMLFADLYAAFGDRDDLLSEDESDTYEEEMSEAYG